MAAFLSMPDDVRRCLFEEMLILGDKIKLLAVSSDAFAVPPLQRARTRS